MRWPWRRRPNRLERILAAAALDDAMARTEAAREPRRAYTKSGRVSHLLGVDGHALCPIMHEWPSEVWLGNSDEEQARAAALPPCRACEHVAGKAAS